MNLSVLFDDKGKSHQKDFMGHDQAKVEYFPVHISLLMPDWQAPCGVYFYYKGKYLEVIKQGQTITIDLLVKLHKEENFFGHIRSESKKVWEEWIFKRYPAQESLATPVETMNKKIHVQMAKFITGPQEKIVPKNPNNYLPLIQDTKELFSSCVKAPALHWFFESNVPPKIFEHNANTTYMMCFFCLYNIQLIEKDGLKKALMAAAIHRQELMDPKQYLDYQNTINVIKKRNINLPSAILQIILNQDELYSGKGFPNKLKGEQIPQGVNVLSLIKFFHESYAGLPGGSKREKMEKTREKILARKEDFDPEILQLFNEFLELVDIKL